MSDQQGVVAGQAGARGIPQRAMPTVSNLKPPPRHPFGRGVVDRFTDVVGTPLHKTSPLIGNAYQGSATMRTLLGNGYFILVILGGYLGGLAVKDTHGLAVPPVLWLTLTIMALGILDAFTGFIATLVFAVGVIATGHLFSSHLVEGPHGTQGMLYAFTGILTMAFLWFIGPQLPRRIRLLGFNSIKSRFQRRWTMAADFFVVTLLTILILGALPVFVPLFTGADKEALTQVVMQNHLVLIKIVVGIAAFVRVGLDEIVHANYEELPRTTGRHRGPLTRWLLRLAGALIVLALVWEIIGTVWQWPVIWVLLISLELFSAAGERFLRPSAIYRYVPRNLFRIVTLLLFDEYAARVLSGRIISGIELLAWLVLLLVAVIAVYAILDGPDDLEEGDRPATWLTRIIGILVIVALFVLSQGIYSVPAAPYLNPKGLAISGNGTLFIADTGNNRVIAISPNGLNRSKVGSMLDGPAGVADDPSSSLPALYVANTGKGEVLAVPTGNDPTASVLGPVPLVGAATTSPATPSSEVVVSGLSEPEGLATDAEGRLFICETGTGKIIEVQPGKAPFVFATGLDGPVAVAVDPFGRVYVTDTGRGLVRRYNTNKNGRATSSVVVMKGLNDPSGVAADAQGNFYVSNTGANTVLEHLSNGHVIKVMGPFDEPTALAVDGQGHLYVADDGTGTVINAEPVYVKTSLNVGPRYIATAAALTPSGVAYTVNVSTGTLERVTRTSDSVVCSHLSFPTGVAYSANRLLYVAQAGNGTVSLVNPSNCALRVIAYGLPGIGSLSADPYGGLYAVQEGLGNVLAISAQGKVQILARKIPNPTSVVRDAYGYLDVSLKGTKANNGAIWRLLPGGTADVIAQHLDEPTGLTADFNGDIFYITTPTHTIYENRGLLGTQIIFHGDSFDTDPVSMASNLAGDVVVFPLVADRTIHLRRSTTHYTI